MRLVMKLGGWALMGSLVLVATANSAGANANDIPTEMKEHELRPLLLAGITTAAKSSAFIKKPEIVASAQPHGGLDAQISPHLLSQLDAIYRGRRGMGVDAEASLAAVGDQYLAELEALVSLAPQNRPVLDYVHQYLAQAKLDQAHAQVEHWLNNGPWGVGADGPAKPWLATSTAALRRMFGLFQGLDTMAAVHAPDAVEKRSGLASGMTVWQLHHLAALRESLWVRQLVAVPGLEHFETSDPSARHDGMLALAPLIRKIDQRTKPNHGLMHLDARVGAYVPILEQRALHIARSTAQRNP